MTTKTYAAKSKAAPLEKFEIERRKIGADDVQIAIDYCGSLS